MSTPKPKTPGRLSISYSVDRVEVLHNGPDAITLREDYARRNLGAKFMDSIDVDRPVTVRLRRHEYDDPRSGTFNTMLALELMPVQTMRVVMREFEPRSVEYREPSPKPKPPSLWQRYCNYIDAVRGSLGG